jgi:hypothetical protein
MTYPWNSWDDSIRNVLLNLYSEQVVRPGGVLADSLPYTETLSGIVRECEEATGFRPERNHAFRFILNHRKQNKTRPKPRNPSGHANWGDRETARLIKIYYVFGIPLESLAETEKFESLVSDYNRLSGDRRSLAETYQKLLYHRRGGTLLPLRGVRERLEIDSSSMAQGVTL